MFISQEALYLTFQSFSPRTFIGGSRRYDLTGVLAPGWPRKMGSRVKSIYILGWGNYHAARQKLTLCHIRSKFQLTSHLSNGLPPNSHVYLRSTCKSYNRTQVHLPTYTFQALVWLRFAARPCIIWDFSASIYSFIVERQIRRMGQVVG